jgi:hypothetical protein
MINFLLSRIEADKLLNGKLLSRLTVDSFGRVVRVHHIMEI